jgi:hypothetical protein
MAYLLSHYDADLPVKDEKAAGLAKQERERLTRACALIDGVKAIPRRIGAEATGEELAADKKRARRVRWALSQALDSWGGPVREKQDVAKEAAQLDWNTWWGEQQVHLNNRIVYIATWGIKRNQERWAKSAVVKLNNELHWVSYAMR